MKVYVYNNQEYNTERQVRQAIFKEERKAFDVCKTETEWAKHGVTVVEKEVVLTEEQMARQVRFQRDRLLKQSDYYVMPDYPSTADGLEVVKAYRQTLRDITKQTSFPFEVIYPEKPSVLE